MLTVVAQMVYSCILILLFLQLAGVTFFFKDLLIFVCVLPACVYMHYVYAWYLRRTK